MINHSNLWSGWLKRSTQKQHPSDWGPFCGVRRVYQPHINQNSTWVGACLRTPVKIKVRATRGNAITMMAAYHRKPKELVQFLFIWLVAFLSPHRYNQFFKFSSAWATLWSHWIDHEAWIDDNRKLKEFKQMICKGFDIICPFLMESHSV